jgi:hypothetical protein
MAQRTYKRLTVARVKALAKVSGMHPDGDGLYFSVTTAGVASWTYRYMQNGRERSMGLGPLRHVSLADARRLGDEARQLRRAGVDPLTARRSQRQSAALAAAQTMSFRQAAVAYITAHRAGWRNARHAGEWSRSLEAYAYPVFGDVPVQAVDVGLVMQAVEPIWTAKSATAGRCVGALRRSWTGPSRAATAMARTRRGGAAISRTFCRDASRGPGITRRCPLAKSPASWPNCAAARAALPALSNF